MSTEKTNPPLGKLIRELMEQHSWSMGRLSSLTAIDKATISRIVNGKRKANLQHLEKFSRVFGVPLQKLMAAGGYDMQTEEQKSPTPMQDSLTGIQNMLEMSGLDRKELSLEDIEEELLKYREQAGTEEGKTMILNGFEDKLQKTGSAGPYIDQLKEMYLLYKNKKTSKAELALIGSALLYFILPMDLIPDYIFPIGYLDDAIAVQFVMNLLSLKNY